MKTHLQNQQRYTRQLNLPQVGEGGQEKLAQAKVLVVGAGGLGCAVLPYLVAAGIGTLGIIDGDVVEVSNLHRQVLYTDQDIGKKKVIAAKEKLQTQNPTVAIQVYPEFLNGDNALNIFTEYDIILDATDRIGIRYLINDACVLCDKPFVYGSVYRFEGQVSVFNYENRPTYRCLFPNEKGQVQSCAEVGVMGTTVGLIGMFQANEVIKMILGVGEILSGKLLMYNALTHRQEVFKFVKNESLKITKKFFEAKYRKVSVEKIAAADALRSDGILLDIREIGESPELDTLQIPLSTLENNFDKLKKDQPIFTFCQSGKRSFQAAAMLLRNGFQQVKSIKEGATNIKELLQSSERKTKENQTV
ncbi:MAG: HesA/MoeB/ThiF family protein [Leeuwenhoekiella sp.]